MPEPHQNHSGQEQDYSESLKLYNETEWTNDGPQNDKDVKFFWSLVGNLSLQPDHSSSVMSWHVPLVVNNPRNIDCDLGKVPQIFRSLEFTI